jgi:hypothetical protein
MTRYSRSAITAKEGINHVRSTTESAGSLFIKIEHENDLGVDALIEFIQGEVPLNRQVAVQIKSGPSYFSERTQECLVPVEKHRDYWAKYPLPVIGIVYVPAHGVAYWASIKGLLKARPDATVLRFPASEATKLDMKSFSSIFLPNAVGTVPVLTLAESVSLARSARPDERLLGLLALFRRYPDESATWDELVRAFRTVPSEEIPPVLVYWLAHIPWHSDIASIGTMPCRPAREYGKSLLASFGSNEVLKLISFIDPEEQIARGTLGQSVEAIISSLPDSGSLLRQVLGSPAPAIAQKELAAVILAMNEGCDAIPDLMVLEAAGSRYASELRKHIETVGGWNPYH